MLLIILFARAVILANGPDSINLYFYNPFVTHKIYIYKYKSRNPEYLLKSFMTDKRIKKISLMTNQLEGNENLDFFLFVKNKYWFGGRWINVSTTYQKGKLFLIFYSEERKRKFCYDYSWVEPDRILKIKFE